jgi:sugar lactone lactonase YvrE
MAASSRAFTIRLEMTASAPRSVRCVAPVGALLGEGPLWDPRIKRLVFLDIKGERIFLFDPTTEEIAAMDAPGMVSALGLRAAGGYIAARKEGFAALSLAEGSVDVVAIAAPEADRPRNRFNDGKVDPFGGFWAGTMDNLEEDATAGSWWRLDAKRRATRLDRDFHVTNGPAFDPDRGRVYLTDSARRTIFVAALEEAAIRNKRVFREFGEADGYPDGMEVDRNGDLWVAFWDGGSVRRFSPEGSLVEEVAIPAPRPTSVAFAQDRVYVTSARVGLEAGTLTQFPDSGGLFEIGLSGSLSPAARYFKG